MKLEFLDTLDAILRRGSFAGAADEIGLTPARRQPAGKATGGALRATALRPFGARCAANADGARTCSNNAGRSGRDGSAQGQVDASSLKGG